MKDSRDITNNVRNKILKIIEDCLEESIIIIHGTCIMAEIALYLEQYLSNKSLYKKIVITGAFYHFDGFAPNDVAFNIWCNTIYSFWSLCGNAFSNISRKILLNILKTHIFMKNNLLKILQKKLLLSNFFKILMTGHFQVTNRRRCFCLTRNVVGFVSFNSLKELGYRKVLISQFFR